MEKVYIIGMGPGTQDYLLPIAKRQIQKANCLIGAKRLLNLFVGLNKEKIELEGNFGDVLKYIKENRNTKRIAVLVSGDPGLYSFLGQVSKVLRKEEFVVIPGVSTVQIAFAKIGESWQDAKIVSIHGRDKRNLTKEIKGCDKVFLFTDMKFPPGKIAEYLLRQGIKNRRAIVFRALTYPNEKIVDTNLKALSTHSTSLRVDAEQTEASIIPNKVAPSIIRQSLGFKKEHELCAMIIIK